MKTKLYIIIAFIGALFTGCDKYLDVAPDDRQEVESLEDVAELAANSYSEGSYNFIEWLTDNAAAISDNTQYPWLHENFMWEPVKAYEGQDTPTHFWSNTYTAIAHANQALEEIEKIEYDNSDTEYRNAIKGEALLTRAYNHFMLASVFCVHYDQATASSAMGIPYIKAPETELIVKYERGTLKETFDNVESDLIEGLALLSDNYYKGSGKYHFNLNAANALASRFYLYKKDYATCISYANKVLGEGTLPTVFVRDMNEVFTGTSSAEMGTKFTDPNRPSNLLLVRKETGYVTRANSGYQANTAIFNEIFKNSIQGETDYRDKRYWYGGDARFQPKFIELFRYTTATTGYPYFINPELRSEEVVFNRMEANVMTGNLDKALDDYNVFAPTRYSKGGQLSSEDIAAFYGDYSQESMMKFIIAERRKEFLREGLRWFDVKRFNMTFEHTNVIGESSILTENDLRKAVQIPAGAIEKGIEANPR